MREYAKNPEKITRLLGGINPKGHLMPSQAASASGLGTERPVRLFDSLKDTVRVHDLSYRHPAKRAATVKTPHGHYARVDARIPKDWDSLPESGPALKLRAGLTSKAVGEGEDAVSNSKENILRHIKRTAEKLKTEKKPYLEFNKDLGYRTIGSKKKVLLTHATGRGGKGIVTKDHYVSEWGARDGAEPQHIYSHIGKKGAKIKKSLKDPMTNTGGYEAKIKAKVPEDLITYRPSDTGRGEEAVTHRKDFKESMLRFRRPRLK